MRARAAALTFATVIGGLVAVAAQATVDNLRFEVASVRQNNSASSASSISTSTPGRFVTTNVPLRFIILHAYELLDHQLVGAPEWTSTTAYDVTATYPPGTTPSDAETRLMLRQLLEERFQLRTHRDRHEVPVYRLVTSRRDGELGPQLVRSLIDCEQWIAEKRPQAGAGGPSRVPGRLRPACMISASRQGFIVGGTQSIAALTRTLQSFVGRPVIDATNLQGAFDVDLVWDAATDLSGPQSAASTAPGVSIFTALEEQLGLELEAARAPVDVIAIDSVQRPTPD